MLRVAEAVALRVNDMTPAGNKIGLARIHRSKTDRKERGRYCFLVQTRFSVYVGTVRQPALGMERFSVGSVEVGMFKKKALTTRSVYGIVTRLATDAGIKGRFGSHSLRIGSAQSL